MSNRQEVIARAVANLEQAVIAMSEDTGSPLQTQQYQTEPGSQTSTGYTSQPSAPAPRQSQQLSRQNQTVVGTGISGKFAFLNRFTGKKADDNTVIRPANMAGA